MQMRGGAWWAGALVAMAWSAVRAEEAPIRIGVLNDQSGVYSDFGGAGSTLAARMAVEDYGGRVLGRPIEVISADHQNKPDIASTVARRWFDIDNVDAVLDLTTSAVALAVREVAVTRNRALLISSASSPDMTGKACSPVTVHWGFDSYANALVAAKATVRAGGRTWYFLTGDNAGSRAQEAQAVRFLESAGGQMVGSVRHPLGTPDFSSYLMQAQASKANVIALANAGGDTINAIKQSQEFGIVRGGQSIVPLLAFISDVHALGLQAAQGLIFAAGFYWDRTEGTRTWSRRFMDRNQGRAPTVVQAGTYSLVLHFLKSMATAQTEAGDAIVRAMKAQPVNDVLWSNVTIREDGRGLNDMYLVQVKTPAESTGPWDLYKILATVPGAEAYRPLAEGGCTLISAAAATAGQ